MEIYSLIILEGSWATNVPEGPSREWVPSRVWWLQVFFGLWLHHSYFYYSIVILPAPLCLCFCICILQEFISLYLGITWVPHNKNISSWSLADQNTAHILLYKIKFTGPRNQQTNTVWGGVRVRYPPFNLPQCGQRAQILAGLGPFILGRDAIL